MKCKIVSNLTLTSRNCILQYDSSTSLYWIEYLIKMPFFPVYLVGVSKTIRCWASPCDQPASTLAYKHCVISVSSLWDKVFRTWAASPHTILVALYRSLTTKRTRLAMPSWCVWIGEILRLMISPTLGSVNILCVLESWSTMKDGPLQGDDARLAAMGHRPELQRSHSTW